jgi:hypothetical protein
MSPAHREESRALHAIAVEFVKKWDEANTPNDKTADFIRESSGTVSDYWQRPMSDGKAASRGTVVARVYSAVSKLL